MADMGALHTVPMETLMVAFLLLDSQVFQPVAIAHPEDFRSYHFRHSIRPFKSPDSSALASDHASPCMSRQKSECLLPRNNRDYGRRHRCSRSLPLYGHSRFKEFFLSVDYKKDHDRAQCLRGSTGDDITRGINWKERRGRSPRGGNQGRSRK